MDQVERRILSLLDERKDALFAFVEDVGHHPEGGYKEVGTAARVADWLRQCGLPVETGLSVTGVRARMGDSGGCRIGVMGELDAVLCPHHPQADAETGFAHACGHHVQLGVMAGAALALSDPEVRNALDGDVDFLAVPAEEGLSSEWRSKLMQDGLIRMPSGGKAELVRLGVFDDMAAVLAHHVHFADSDADLLLGNGSTNGFLARTVTVRGKAAHAGSNPHEGINALHAASLGLQALAFLRDTFRDEDAVRVHGVMTEGGSVVNVVPDRVVLELMIRAKTLGAMEDAAAKTDRAFRATASAMGAEVEIVEVPGYLPVIASEPDPVQLMAAAILRDETSLMGDSSQSDPLKRAPRIQNVDLTKHNPLSTDVGDLTHLMPVLHMTSGGFSGNLHGIDFKLECPEKAILLPAKLAALTVYHLLRNGAAEAKRLHEGYQPVLSKKDYLERVGNRE